MRKTTVFIPCEKHKQLMASVSRYRRAENMVEGGWADEAPCNCRMRPGTDLYTPEFVASHPKGCGIQGRITTP